MSPARIAAGAEIGVVTATLGAPGTSSSFGRFAGSVTTSFAFEVPSRCSIALGPKAVKSGW